MSWICDQGPYLGIANPKWLPTCDSHLSQCPCVSLAEERDALVACLWWEAEAVLKPSPCLPPGTGCGSPGWRSMVCVGLNQKSKHDWRTGGHVNAVRAYLQIHGHFPPFPKSFSKISNFPSYQKKKKWNSFSICSKTPETPPCQMRLYCSYK